MAHARRIEGTIQLDNGEVVKFSIDGDYGYQQWGNTVEVLGQSVDIVQAMTDALYEDELLD